MALYKGEDKIKDIYLGDVPIFKVYAGEEFCGFFTFSAYNLISNSHLFIDSNSDGVPDGFTITRATATSLINGILTITPTAQYAFIGNSSITLPSTDLLYVYSRFKASSSSVKIVVANPITTIAHSGNGAFEFYSFVVQKTDTSLAIQINANDSLLAFEVDYMGAINITDLVSRGILPSGLTNSQYKDILDNYFNS